MSLGHRQKYGVGGRDLLGRPVYRLAVSPKSEEVEHTCEKPKVTSLLRMERTRLKSAETKTGSAIRSIGCMV